jgi:hypothetical protein
MATGGRRVHHDLQEDRLIPDGREVRTVLPAETAAGSIGANIAEGFGRWSPRDQARFYEIAKGSLEEVRHFLMISERLGFLEPDSLLDRTLDYVCGKIVNLRKSALSRVKK